MIIIPPLNNLIILKLLRILSLGRELSFHSNLSPNTFCSTALCASKPFHNFRNATLYLNKLFCTQTKAEVPGSRQNPKLTLTRYRCKLQEFLSVLAFQSLTSMMPYTSSPRRLSQFGLAPLFSLSGERPASKTSRSNLPVHSNIVSPYKLVCFHCIQSLQTRYLTAS